MQDHSSLPIGRYRHYKGNEYTVLGTARHSETLEELVVYRPEYGERDLWVRPRPMFTERVSVEGQDLPRFQPLRETREQEGASENFFTKLPSAIPDEVVQTLVSANDVRIERIISHGQSSPAGYWYDQEEHEWVILLRGAARLKFETDEIELQPGDFINIPAHQKHRVEWTTPLEPTLWLAVFYRQSESAIDEMV